MLSQGADTCVYDPPVECKPGTQSPADISPGKYVSRLVVKTDGEIQNQIAVRNALKTLRQRGIDVTSHFNLAAAKCEPQLKESDLKSKTERYCTARQRKLDSIEKGDTYTNLITPFQEDDMYKLPKEFNVQHIPALLHAVVYLNDVDIVHSDAHAGNIAKMGDRLVLHDWGRTIVGFDKFKQEMKQLTMRPYERIDLSSLVQWRFPCRMLDTCIVPSSSDDTFRRFMKMYDVISILGSVRALKLVQDRKIEDAMHIASSLLTSNIPPAEMKPYVDALIDSVFSDEFPAVLEPYKPAATPPPTAVPVYRPVGTLEASLSSTPLPSSPPPVRRNVPRLMLPPQAQGQAAPPPLQIRRPTSGAPSWGSARTGTAKKLCKCIKSVRKTIKARPGISKEKGAIAICVKSIVQTKRRTLKKFKCGKKPRLVTQKRKRVGGATTVPNDIAWDRFMQAYNYDAKPYDRQIWGALKQNSGIQYVPTSTSARVFLRGALLFANPELIEIMHDKGAKYSDFVNALDELQAEYGTKFANDLTRSKEIIQKYQLSS